MPITRITRAHHTLRPALELPNVPIADNFGPGIGGCDSRMSHLDASLWTRIDLHIRSKMAWSHPSVPLDQMQWAEPVTPAGSAHFLI